MAIAIGAYVLVDSASQRSVQLRKDVQGNVQQTVDDVKGLISDNTR